MILQGDGIAGMASLPDASVQLVCADLPSGMTNAPFDVPLDLAGLWKQVQRVLHPRGNVVLFASHLSYAGSVVASAPSLFRYEYIWEKSLATGFHNARRRPLRAHEYVLVFNSGGRQATYNVQMMEGASPIHKARRTKASINYNADTQETHARAGAEDRYPVSVLQFASVGTSSRQRRHPQQKPVPLLRWLIRTYSTPDGGLIVDPCAGSGSCGEAAAAEGRLFRGWELSRSFFVGGES